MIAERIYLSVPHMSGLERGYVDEAFDTNWLSSVGPNLDNFEFEMSAALGNVMLGLAVSSGTAALHLVLRHAGVGAGDRVAVSTLTFAGSVWPIMYLGAQPVFLDSETHSGNLDPNVVQEYFRGAASRGELPKVLIAVHLYGQHADIDALVASCRDYGVILVEDAAESLGATYRGRPTGISGDYAILSFNGNKIITTSGGGMLVSNDEALIERARFLSTQARDPAPHYQHSSLGFNYRMSNVLAAIGRGQLRALPDRVAARRHNFEMYREKLREVVGIEFMPLAPWGEGNFWLTCITIDPEQFGATREDVRLALEAHNIESRPLWKPLHLQPVFAGCRVRGGSVSEAAFERGLCLPSGSSLSAADRDRVVEILLDTPRRKAAGRI